MATAEERQKILEMVAAGKLSAEEAAALLTAETPPEKEAEKATESVVPEAAPLKPAAEKEPAPAGSGPSWLRIQVDDLASGRSKVKVNIPLHLMKAGLALGRSFAPELRDVDWDHLSTSLAEGAGGLLVEVQDDEDGEHVRIFVE
jgi:hypothetical protein